jgi:hypothetical protein
MVGWKHTEKIHAPDPGRPTTVGPLRSPREPPAKRCAFAAAQAQALTAGAVAP